MEGVNSGPPSRAIGIFAHPDDEVFCAGGAFRQWSGQGTHVTVVSATRGEAGQIRDADVATRATLRSVREGELRAACASLGVQDVRVLDHADGHVSECDPTVLAKELAALVHDVEADVVVTFGPDGAYGHPDHVAIGEATRRAVTLLAQRGRRVTLLRSHFPQHDMSIARHLADWLTTSQTHRLPASSYGLALSLFAEESTTMRFASDDVRIAWFPPKTAIVEQGEPATSLCLILSGSVDVIEEVDGVQRRVRHMREGEFFGELGLSRGHKRSATVVATSNVTCLVLSPDAPSAFSGRGSSARAEAVLPSPRDMRGAEPSLLTVDVVDQLDAKLTALAAHRSQYPVDPHIFPRSMLIEMYGREHFLCS
jgi:LmbE family N-acetylglucosaminyl deacetylase